MHLRRPVDRVPRRRAGTQTREHREEARRAPVPTAHRRRRHSAVCRMTSLARTSWELGSWKLGVVGRWELAELGIDKATPGYRVASATSSMIGHGTWSGSVDSRGRTTSRSRGRDKRRRICRHPRRDLPGRHDREALRLFPLGAVIVAVTIDAEQCRKIRRRTIVGGASASSRAATPRCASRPARGRCRADSSGRRARRISRPRATEST